MSAKYITVAELIATLSKCPQHLRVAVIYPDVDEHYGEGELGSVEHIEIITVEESRSGFRYPAMGSDTEQVVLLSDVGVQWLDNK